MHLDPDADGASRRPHALDALVANLVAHDLTGPGRRVLVLDCGPGLVAQRLAQEGCEVTGLDISASSLTYARSRAAEAGLDITYRLLDFRQLDAASEFDLVLQSYGELSTLDEPARDRLLAAARRALVPDGALVFGVTTPAAHPPRARSWSMREGGLWRDDQHHVLTERHHHAGDLVCEQYAVVGTDGVRVYRMWCQDCTPETLVDVVERAGYRVEYLWIARRRSAASPRRVAGSARTTLVRRCSAHRGGQGAH